MGWQLRAASGRCIIGSWDEHATLQERSSNFGVKSFDVDFTVLADGSILCKRGSETEGGEKQGSLCSAVYPDVMQLVVRRIGLQEHAALNAGPVSELQSLDNQHLPLGPRIAVLMTGELRTFKHAVRRARTSSS